MIFGPLISRIKSRLTVKLVLIFVLFFSAVSILLSSFFMAYNKSLLENELRKRIRSLAQNLAYNSSIYFSPHDSSKLNSLISGVKQEPDIAHVFLTNLKGRMLASGDTSYAGKTIAVPADIDSSLLAQWFPAGQPSLRRIIAPIYLELVIVDTQNTLLASSKGQSLFPDGAGAAISYYYPSFNPKGDAVTFTASRKAEINPETISIMSVSLRDSSLSLLVKGTTHGFWGWSGGYLAFCGIKNESGLYVACKETGIAKKIAEDTTGRYNMPCFTPDDRYVIATLPTGNDNESLFKISRDGGERERLTFQKGQHWWPDCSPDGEWIVYNDIISLKLYAYNTQTKKSSFVFPGLKDMQRGASFSPDGGRICYLRFLSEINGWEIFIADFPFSTKSGKTGGPYGRRITLTGGYKWLTLDWSPDGKWIAFADRGIDEFYDIMIVSPEGGNPVNLTGMLKTQRKKIGYAVLDVSMKNLDSAIENGNRIALLISFLFIGIGALGALFLVRSMVRPVQNVGDAAGAIARGDLNQKVSENRSDEIGTLSRSFNRMAEQLKISRRELEQKHQELEKAYQELSTLDKAKDDFLSLVSHELRTPLSSIAAFTELLLMGWVRSKKKRDEFLSTMLSECRRLTRLVNDVLDLSKIEAGRMTFNRSPLNIRDLVEAVRQELQPLFGKKGVSFVNAVQDSGLRALGDRDRVSQVLTNVISNAAKYNREGGSIHVSMRHDPESCVISVSDTGGGIAEQDIPKVFDRFAQLSALNHHREGAGLGMSISRSIIERLDGRIWIESELGRGTTVSFSLPRSDDAPCPEEKTVPEDIPVFVMNNHNIHSRDERKILIADDEKPLRMALDEFVKNAGFLPIDAENGREALRLAKEQKPALIFLDVMMPDISGLEVCRTLKNDPAASGIKIVMLSARGQEREKEEGLQAGADRYITKPFSYEELEGAIKDLLAV